MSAEHPTPWRIEGWTIRDADGHVVVSAINPCNMATRREIVEAVTDRHAFGNTAAMREALIPWISLGEWLIQNAGKDALGRGIAEIVSKLRARVDEGRAALSAPPRQCDIGTAEEQEERYKATGEVYHTSTLTNALAWAQTPYAEEGGAK